MTTPHFRPAAFSKERLANGELVEQHPLGTGSFGSVVAVADALTGAKCAVKKIELRHLSDRKRQQALNEANHLRALEHPCITAYFGSFVHDGVVHIAMELCDGGSLDAWLDRQNGHRFTADVVLDCFVQVSAALRHVHRHKILHRDVKASNVFLSEPASGSSRVAPQLKLGDFGISRQLDVTADMASTLVGTPYYLSPEVCESSPYGSAADCWAVGVLLYQLASLRLPFSAKNLPSLAKAICTSDYPPLPALAAARAPKGMPGASEEVHTLVGLLLRKSPSERITMEQVLSECTLAARLERMEKGWLQTPKGGSGVGVAEHVAAPLPTSATNPRNATRDAPRLAKIPSDRLLSSSTSSGGQTCPSHATPSAASAASSSTLASGSSHSSTGSRLPPQPSVIPGLLAALSPRDGTHPSPDLLGDIPLAHAETIAAACAELGERIHCVLPVIKLNRRGRSPAPQLRILGVAEQRLLLLAPSRRRTTARAPKFRACFWHDLIEADANPARASTPRGQHSSTNVIFNFRFSADPHPAPSPPARNEALPTLFAERLAQTSASSGKLLEQSHLDSTVGLEFVTQTQPEYELVLMVDPSYAETLLSSARRASAAVWRCLVRPLSACYRGDCWSSTSPQLHAALTAAATEVDELKTASDSTLSDALSANSGSSSESVTRILSRLRTLSPFLSAVRALYAYHGEPVPEGLLKILASQLMQPGAPVIELTLTHAALPSASSALALQSLEAAGAIAEQDLATVAAGRPSHSSARAFLTFARCILGAIACTGVAVAVRTGPCGDAPTSGWRLRRKSSHARSGEMLPLPAEAVEALSVALRLSPTLRDLSLDGALSRSSAIAMKAVALLADAIPTAQGPIKKFALLRTGHIDDVTAARLLGNLRLMVRPLVELDLGGSNMSTDTIGKLFELLVTSPWCTSLRRLGLSDNRGGSATLTRMLPQLVMLLTALSRLDVANTGMDSGALLRTIAGCDAACSRFESILLSGNRIDAAAGESLATVAAKAPRLLYLGLADSGIPVSAVGRLLAAAMDSPARKNSSLSLDLSGVRLGTEFGTQLAQHLPPGASRDCARLSGLYARNAALGDTGVAAVLRACAAHGALIQLDLSKNWPTSSRLRSTSRSKPVLDLVAPLTATLRDCAGLRYLALAAPLMCKRSNAELGAVEELSVILGSHRSLTAADLSRLRFDAQALRILGAALRSNETILALSLGGATSGSGPLRRSVGADATSFDGNHGGSQVSFGMADQTLAAAAPIVGNSISAEGSVQRTLHRNLSYAARRHAAAEPNKLPLMDDPFAASIERHMLLRVFEVLAMQEVAVSRAATPQLLPHVRTADSTVSQPLSRHGALSVARGGADDTTAERRADELMRTGHVANREGRTEEARQHFCDAFGLTGRVAAQISAANMSLKLGDIDTAVRSYKLVIAREDLSATQREYVERKLIEVSTPARSQNAAGGIFPLVERGLSGPGPTPDAHAVAAELALAHDAAMRDLGVSELHLSCPPVAATNRRPSDVRVLQWSLLPAGLAESAGFVVRDVLGPEADALGKPAEFDDQLISAPNPAARAARMAPFTSPRASLNNSVICDWDRRWVRIREWVASTTPDIIALQGLDRFSEALFEMRRLGYEAAMDPGAHYSPAYLGLAGKLGAEGHGGVTSSSAAAASCYADHLARGGIAFAPELSSASRRMAQANGDPSADDDGVAIFWRRNAWSVHKLDHLAWSAPSQGAGGCTGAVRVRLFRRADGARLTVLCAQLRGAVNALSDNADEGELASNSEAADLEIVCAPSVDRAGRPAPSLREWYAESAREGPTLLAISSRSLPGGMAGGGPAGEPSRTAWVVLRDAVPGTESVWDAWPGAAVLGIAGKGKTPVTTNVIRGPLAPSPAKAGEHRCAIADKVLSVGLGAPRHAWGPVQFTDAEHARREPLPSVNIPSDHYPVLVDYSLNTAPVADAKAAASPPHIPAPLSAAARLWSALQRRPSPEKRGSQENVWDVPHTAPSA